VGGGGFVNGMKWNVHLEVHVEFYYGPTPHDIEHQIPILANCQKGGKGMIEHT